MEPANKITKLSVNQTDENAKGSKQSSTSGPANIPVVDGLDQKTFIEVLRKKAENITLLLDKHGEDDEEYLDLTESFTDMIIFIDSWMDVFDPARKFYYTIMLPQFKNILLYTAAQGRMKASHHTSYLEGSCVIQCLAHYIETLFLILDCGLRQSMYYRDVQDYLKSFESFFEQNFVNECQK